MSTSEQPQIDVVVMAAGKGTRMKSRLPKVLQRLAGVPLVQHVLNTASQLNARSAVVITGHGAEQVEPVVLAPNPEWVKTLPNGKLPDRKDFMTYDRDLAGRVKVWNAAARASQQLAEEFSSWLQNPSLLHVQPL